jgi:hypothetical protein
MMFSGSFDPAYTLTIFALPTLIQPTMNKRNASLIQSNIYETLGVAPSRGYVRFVATAEEDVANGGKTVAGEMDDLEKATSEEAHANKEPSKVSRTKRMLSGRVSSIRTAVIISIRCWISLPYAVADTAQSSVNNFKPTTPATNGSPEKQPTSPASTDETPMMITTIPECPPTPPEKEGPDVEKRTKTAARKKSFGFGALLSSMGSTKERRSRTSSGVEG